MKLLLKTQVCLIHLYFQFFMNLVQEDKRIVSYDCSKAFEDSSFEKNQDFSCLCKNICWYICKCLNHSNHNSHSFYSTPKFPIYYHIQMGFYSYRLSIRDNTNPYMNI